MLKSKSYKKKISAQKQKIPGRKYFPFYRPFFWRIDAGNHRQFLVFSPGKWQSPLPCQIPTRTRKHDCVENCVTVTKGEFWESFPLPWHLFQIWKREKLFPLPSHQGAIVWGDFPSLTGIWDYSTVWHRAVRGWREIFKTGGEREGEGREPFGRAKSAGTRFGISLLWAPTQRPTVWQTFQKETIYFSPGISPKV